MGWTSYNKFGEVILTADTLDGYDSTDFVFKDGDVMLGVLGIELANAYMYARDTITDKMGRLVNDHLGFGTGSGGVDWRITRTSAGIAQLGAGHKLRDTSDPVSGNDLSRKQYIDTAIAGLTGTGAGLPTGTILDFAGSAAPAGFLVCDGSQVLRTSYPDLDAVISTTFGAYTNGSGGAGTTHFRLPDFRGRTSVGAGTGAGDNSAGGAGSVPAGTSLTARARGSWGGGETHSLTPAQTPLRTHTHTGTTSTESTSHSHSATTGNDNTDHGHSGSTGGINANHFHSGSTGGRSAFHQHGPGTQSNHMTIDWNQGNGGVGFGAGTAAGGVPVLTNVDNADHGHSFSTGFVSSDHGHAVTVGGRSAFHQHAVTTGGQSVNHTHTMTTGNPSVAEANGTAHNNVQPFLVVNKIIKT